jgi:hypothetical protein
MSTAITVPNAGNGIGNATHGHTLAKIRRQCDNLAVEFATRGNSQGEGREEHVREIRRHAAELAGPNPSALVESLAMTTAIAHYDLRFRQALAGPLTFNPQSQRFLDHAMRRYLSVVRMLSAVQRLPVVQLNIGVNQVNMAGPTGGSLQ